MIQQSPFGVEKAKTPGEGSPIDRSLWKAAESGCCPG